jgi:hypothetical protein
MARSLTITADAARQIGPNTPLRLDAAAAIAYPDGSMTASGLRREHRRGRLIIERTAGKDYTTLAHINTMRDQCRIEAGGLGSTCVAPDATKKVNTRRSGSSETERINTARAALHTMLQPPNAPSPSISRASTPELHDKPVAAIPIKFRSRTS